MHPPDAARLAVPVRLKGVSSGAETRCIESTQPCKNKWTSLS